MLQRLSSKLVKHNGTTLFEQLERINISKAFDIRDFVDGIKSDQEVIQSCIDAATLVGTPHSRSLVLITPKDKEGNPWRFSSIDIKSNIIVRGAGGTLKLNDNVCTDSSKAYYLIHNLNGNNSWIDGLTIDGNARGGNTKFTVADTVTLGGQSSYITNCTLLDAPDSGLMFSNVKDGGAIGNRIEGATDCGIYANAGSYGSSRNTIIALNFIKDTRSSAIACKRYYSDALIADNVFQVCGNGITFEGFDVEVQGMRPRRIHVDGLVMRDIGFPFRAYGVAERAISINGAEDITLSGVKGYNISGFGAYVKDANGVYLYNSKMSGYKDNPHSGGNHGVLIESCVGGSFNSLDLSGWAGRAMWIQRATSVEFLGGRWVSEGSMHGCRVEANADLLTFSPSFIQGGGDADLEWFSGARANVGNMLLGKATGAAKYGYQVFSAGQGLDPNGRIVPRCVGDHCVTLADNNVWIAVGLSNTDWKKITQ